MDKEIIEQDENQDQQTPVDPWATAFAALDKEKEKADQATSDTGEQQGDIADSEGVDGNESSSNLEAGDSSQVSADAGGSSDLGGTDGGEDENPLDDLFRFTEEEVSDYKESLRKSVEEQTLHDVANAYLKKGARNTNGKLGASINDPDICKRDHDGVPRFYNPDTGREFNGDNPRRQAQEWVDDYNKELAKSFNKTCQDYSEKLMQEQGHGLAVIEFAPKYAKLDPVRKAMFEAVIEDYEVKDSDGDLVGYSCDLDKALTAVNRQVRIMQERFKNSVKTAEDKKPTGPALDMKSTGSTDGSSKPEFKSIAEAMEYQQDQLLKKMKGNK